MEWIKTLDPTKQVARPEEIEVALQKLRLLRGLAPKAITGDISNMLNQVVNASGGNVRKTITIVFPMLVDKMLEFVDHWAVKVGSSNTTPVKEESKAKAPSSAGSFQIVQSEWQDYDDVERERLIPLLQTELKSLREMYQERVDEVNSFEDRLAAVNAEHNMQQQQLQRRFAALMEEHEAVKRRSSAASVTSQPVEGSEISADPTVVESQQQEISQLQEQVMQLQADIVGLHQEIKSLLREKDVLIHSSSQLDEELHTTIMARDRVTLQMQEYRRQAETIPQLETSIAMLQQQKAQTEANLRKSETQAKNQEKMVETLAKNLQKKEKEAQKVAAQMEALREQLTKAEDEQNALTVEKSLQQTNIQHLEQQVDELQECKEILTKNQEQQQRQIVGLEHEVVKMKVQTQNAVEDLAAMTNEKDMLLMALETSQQKLREKIEQLEGLESTGRPGGAGLGNHIADKVGNLVDFFDQRHASTSPVPGGSAPDGAAGAAGGRSFPLLKRLSTGISSLTHQATAQGAAPDASAADASNSRSAALAASIRSRYSQSASDVVGEGSIFRPAPASSVMIDSDDEEMPR